MKTTQTRQVAERARAQVKAAARARRFDAELAELLDVPVEIVGTTDPCAANGWSWRVAATVLLALTATVGVAWERGRAQALLQEPAVPERPLVQGPRGSGGRAGDVKAWPPDVAVAHLWLGYGTALARDLSDLAPFTGLRVLAIRARTDAELAWGVEGLQPLAGLRQLEVLEIPVGTAWSAAHFQVLAELPNLRFLTLHLQRPLQGDDVAQLARLPAMAALVLRGGSLTGPVLRQFATLPKLEALTLSGVGGCSESVLAELGALARLRRLDLENMGIVAQAEPVEAERALAMGPDHQGQAKSSVGLTAGVARTLAGLPALRALVVTSTACEAAAWRALPLHLEHLGVLASPHVGPEVFEALARFPKLQRLDLDSGGRETRWGRGVWMPKIEAAIQAAMALAPPREAVWQAQARLLETVPLRELRYLSEIPSVVRERIPRLPLVALTLRHGTPEDLAILAALPALRAVTLDNCVERLADLEPLTKVPNLLRLDLLWAPAVPIAAVRELLPNVQVASADG